MRPRLNPQKGGEPCLSCQIEALGRGSAFTAHVAARSALRSSAGMACWQPHPAAGSAPAEAWSASMKDEERGHGAGACPLRPVSRALAPHPLEGVCRFFYEIAAHVERWVGPIEHVHHELASEHVHIDVFHVPPNPKRELHTLVTAGMSTRPMKPPAEAAECRLVELVLTLPRDWSAGPAMYESAAHAWPLEGMIELARLPHASGEWIWGGHSVADPDARAVHSSP